VPESMLIDLENDYEHDLFYNIESWSEESNVLCITGISSSGKSTLANALIDEVGARVISLDSFTLNDPLNGTSGSFMELYRRAYPGIEIVPTEPSQGNFATPQFCHFLRFLIPALEERKPWLFIVEGCHFLDLDENILEELSVANRPLIIKQISNKRYAKNRRQRDPDLTDDEIRKAIALNNARIREFQEKIERIRQRQG